jgi:transketolase
MMRLPAIYVYTHDSVGLGEDGPTHQPIEQLIGLRAVPGLVVLRPADANEAAEAWRTIIALNQPACLVLTRQKLPTIDRTRYAPAAGVARGAYVLADATNGRPDVILIGTGSEVSLCLAAREVLASEGIGARVVSMPSWELFDRQEARYRDEVLTPSVRARVAVEAASTLGWDRYVGPRGATIGMRGFGASAPVNDLMKEFGFTPENVAQAAKAQIAFWRHHGEESPAGIA